MPIDAPQCSRHGESTRLSCATCAEPVCPKCGVRTGVGLKCEECARPAAPVPAPVHPRRTRRPWWPGGLAAAGVLLVAVVLGVVLAGGPGSAPVEPQAAVGRWVQLPAVPGIRGTASAVVLQDGSVLVAGGGVGAVPLATAQIYHPDTNRWSATGSLQQARRGHAAVRLPDGRVLVAGGIAGDDVLASAEIYDPETGRWERTGSMATARLGLTLTTLRDGRVLATGGTSGGRGVQPLATAEIYDPATGTWTRTGPMTVPRFDHTATLLPDGRVLLAGGLGASGAPQASTAIYDPAADAFLYAGRMREARSNHAASLLPTGAVLVAGGRGGPDGTVTIAGAEIFGPDEEGWSSVAPLSRSREGASATTLVDGRVLVAGGQTVHRGVRTSLAAAEVFDPESATWRPAGNMQCPRSEHAAVRLPDGGVLVVAGDAAFPGQAPVASNCAELYRPSTVEGATP